MRWIVAEQRAKFATTDVIMVGNEDGEGGGLTVDETIGLDHAVTDDSASGERAVSPCRGSS